MGRRAFGRPARAQPSHHRQPPHVRLFGQASLGGEEAGGTDRDGHVVRPADFDAVERWRGDADDIEGPVAEPDGPAHHSCVSAVFPLPECVTDHGAGSRTARAVIGIDEDPASQRWNAQHTEEAAADVYPLGAPDFADACQVKTGRPPGRDTGERFLAVTNLLPLGVRQFGIAAEEVAGPAAGPADAHLDQFFGVGYRQHTQADGIDDLEDGGVRADAECERQDGDGREPRCPPQEPEPEAHVTPERVQAADGVHPVDTLADLEHVAQLALRGPTGFVWRHPPGDVLVGLDLQVCVEFASPFNVPLLPPEKTSPSHRVTPWRASRFG